MTPSLLFVTTLSLLLSHFTDDEAETPNVRSRTLCHSAICDEIKIHTIISESENYLLLKVDQQILI